ncbi:unnamed protein product [Rhizopus stolonifer]
MTRNIALRSQAEVEDLVGDSHYDWRALHFYQELQEKHKDKASVPMTEEKQIQVYRIQCDHSE